MARQQAQDSGVPASTQVMARGTRWRFTAYYKASIVQEAAQCRAAGEIGALLRREGLFSSRRCGGSSIRPACDGRCRSAVGRRRRGAGSRRP
jgi:hypothetical protein